MKESFDSLVRRGVAKIGIDAVCEKFSASIPTVFRWADGTSRPAPAYQKLVEDRLIEILKEGDEASKEDRRKTGLKTGLRQLTLKELARILVYNKPMCLDEFNYDEEKQTFCPLAVAKGLPKQDAEQQRRNGQTGLDIRLTNADVVWLLEAIHGLSVFNTRGIEGTFFQHPNRERDFWIAFLEVLNEKAQAELERITLDSLGDLK
mgnify:CR=1 FL=1